MEHISPAIPSIISGLCLLFAGWAGGALLEVHKQRKAKITELAELKALREELEAEKAMRDALYKGMKSSLRKDLVDAYGEYVTAGKSLTVERFHELTEGYNAYVALGGNGTGKTMYEAICEVPITIVK